MPVTKQKALCYITRERGGHQQLLVFDHVGMPEAGTQVPGGGVDPGETPEQGALREAFEESGLSGLQVQQYLGMFRYPAPELGELHERHIFHLTPIAALPDTWEHVVTAGEDDKGLRFAYYWLDVERAATVLIGHMGDYLGHLTVR